MDSPLNESLCIDCYGAPARRLGATLCVPCYQKAHRRRHYHEVVWNDPDRLERHRQQSRDARRRWYERNREAICAKRNAENQARREAAKKEQPRG